MNAIKIQGLSLDEELNKILNDKNNKYVIHSVFDNVINIRSINGRMYTITNELTANAPYTLKTDFDDSFKKYIDIDSKIIIDNNNIKINNIEISLSNMKIWSSKRKEISSVYFENIEHNIEYYNEKIRLSGKEGGCKYLYLKYFLKIDITGNLIERELCHRIIKLYDNLKINIIDTEEIRKIVGFGMGLTPSGDDFLTGFLGVISMNESANNVFNKLSESIIPRLNLTTDVSSNMLRAATEEKFSENLNNFILSFLHDNIKSFEHELKKLLDIGSSSGTDMSIGVVLGFMYLINNRKWGNIDV